jgi:hypothetical protein
VAETTKPLLDRLNVKPGAKVALLDFGGAAFVKLLRERGADVVEGKPRRKVDMVFVAAADPRGALQRLKQVKSWIEYNGAIWVIRPKGPLTTLRDTDLIQAGLDAGLVDNKIVSFSDTHGAMRFVFRLKDRPK